MVNATKEKTKYT